MIPKKGTWLQRPGEDYAFFLVVEIDKNCQTFGYTRDTVIKLHPYLLVNGELQMIHLGLLGPDGDKMLFYPQEMDEEKFRAVSRSMQRELNSLLRS